MKNFARLLMVLAALVIGIGGAMGCIGDRVSASALAYHDVDRKVHETKGFPTISISDLPAEALHTLKLIKQGGPFPYRKDGTTFHNREKRLPIRPRNYYKEYTVKTPRVKSRGARRIIVGSEGEFYYTSDHYRTFRLITE